MSKLKGRPTTDRKNLRLELRLTEREKDMLDFCVEVYKLSKGEIIRRSIIKMFNEAEHEAKLQKQRDDVELVIFASEKERLEQIRTEIYTPSYREAYAEKYAELIVDPMYKRREDVITAANVYATKIAEAMVKRAENEFLGVDDFIKEMKK